MTKRKHDVSEWIPARHVAHIWTLLLGRKVRPDQVHRVASRLGFHVHRIDQTHSLYLQSEAETITAKDLPERKKKNREDLLFHHAHAQEDNQEQDQGNQEE